jgi:pimeloyl-ACP methyl ester carboxylesterase
MNVQTGYAEINGAWLYYEMAGAGDTVTLVHAGVADRRMWDGQFEPLAQHFRVIRYDLRGFGQTTAPALPYSHVDDLHALLAHLGVERTALIGCSMGGTTALDVTLQYPEMVSALVLVCADPSGFLMTGAPPPLILELIEASKAGDAEGMARLAVQIWGVGERRKPEQIAPEFRDLVYEMSLIGFKNQLAGLGEQQQPASPAIEHLSDVRTPTLIIDGAEDSTAVHEAGELMAREIAGARRVVMADVAHLPSLERPDEFNRIVLEFLKASI